MTYDNDFEALRPVCGAFLALVWVCAPRQSVVRVFFACLWAIRALFRAVWAARPVCQTDTKGSPSRGAPVSGGWHAVCFPTDAAPPGQTVDRAATDCRHRLRSNSTVRLAPGCADAPGSRAGLA